VGTKTYYFAKLLDCQIVIRVATEELNRRQDILEAPIDKVRTFALRLLVAMNATESLAQ
jgi:hypothetical protein